MAIRDQAKPHAATIEFAQDRISAGNQPHGPSKLRVRIEKIRSIFPGEFAQFREQGSCNSRPIRSGELNAAGGSHACVGLQREICRGVEIGERESRRPMQLVAPQFCPARIGIGWRRPEFEERSVDCADDGFDGKGAGGCTHEMGRYSVRIIHAR